MRHNLSEVTALLRDRRSISPERISGRKVHREIVELILTNATWAPSHGMTQPWRFTAYVDEGMKAIGPRLSEWYKKAAGDQFSQAKVDKYQKRGERVSALVVIGMVPDPAGRISQQDEMLAVACAVQNMYLTCTAHGIGGFWSTPEFLQFCGQGGADILAHTVFYHANWPGSHDHAYFTMRNGFEAFRERYYNG